jgi:hypothetical protein
MNERERRDWTGHDGQPIRWSEKEREGGESKLGEGPSEAGHSYTGTKRTLWGVIGRRLETVV